jgi:hypothetical protein
MDRDVNTPPPDMVSVPDEQRARQAVASLGGHLFQAARAATEWVQLPEGATLLIEVAEDYAVLARGALAMTQTKQEYSASVTLRSDGVRKSLAGLVAFQDANPSIRVTLAYLTTATVGIEAKSRLPDAISGIAYWQQVSRGADVAPLRQLLLETQRDDRVLKRVREMDDETFRTSIVQSVTWLTASPGLEDATHVLEARLRALGVQRTGYAADGQAALPLLLYRILTTAVGEHRRLTRDDFEREWATATTVGVSVTMMRRLAIGGSGTTGLALLPDPPPPVLSARTAQRRILVDGLRDQLRAGDVLWLHGSSGLGKSQLSRLIEARDNGRWTFVSLGNCDIDGQAARMRDAIGGMAREEVAGLILDDLPVPAPEGLRHWIAAAAMEVSAIPGARIVVTSERAPLPQLCQAFGTLRIGVREAPYLNLDDVADIVRAAGGIPETWASLIHLTCGGGHPRLVDARVAGLASKGWPAGERLAGLGLGSGPSEVVDVRREVSLRLLGELSADAHLLVLRLSGLLGSFDRQLVDAIAATPPGIPRAGALLDYLVGPWIEQERADRYRLSPLLHAAAALLSKEERAGVHEAAIANLIGRNPFPGDLLSSLIVYVMLARHMGGFMFIAKAVIGTAQSAELAHAMFPLTYMKSGEGGLLVPEHPGVSAMVRSAQVIAAVNADPPSMVGQVVSEALAEAERLPNKLRAANKFTTLMAVLGNERADLSPTVWVPMLVRFRELRMGGSVPEEMAEPLSDLDLGGTTPEQMFFAVRSGKVDTVVDLEELFWELERIDPVWRGDLLTASSILFGGPPLFVQSAWSKETTPMTLDAARAEQVYKRLAEQAAGWGEIEVAIECVRSRVVMLDEYLNRHDDALSVLAEAEETFGGSERLIRTKASVLATMGRHEEELALLSTLAPDYGEDEPVERLLMLRTSAISAGKLKRYAEAARLFHEAYRAATEGRPEVLGASVRPGLLTDAAAMEMRDGHFADALASLVLACEIVDADRSADPSLGFARAAITQVTQWAAAECDGRPFPEDPSATPGVCSTLRPKFDPEPHPVHRLNQEWYLLARLEAIANVAAGAERRLLERERTDGVQLQLAVGAAAAQVQAYVERRDAKSLLAILQRYAWLSGRLMAAAGKPPVADAAEQISPDDWSDAEAVVARAAVSGLLGMMLLEGDTESATAANAGAGAISDALSFRIGACRAVVDGGEDIFTAGLASLELILGGGLLNAERLLGVTVRLFIWAKHIGADRLSARIHAVLGRRWLELCSEHRAILSSPRLSVPAIEAAARLEPGIGALARLVEAGRLASSLGLSGEIVAMLRATP